MAQQSRSGGERKPSKGELALSKYREAVGRAMWYETDSSADIPLLLRKCIEAWPLILDALRYARKNPEVDFNLFPISAVWKYAPPFFEHETLLGVQELVASTRALSKYEGMDLPRLTGQALEREECARELWNITKGNPGILARELCAKAGGSQRDSAGTVKIWARFGIIKYWKDGDHWRVALATDMDTFCAGMCQSCWSTVKGKREWFFRESTCPRCGGKGYFFISPG